MFVHECATICHSGALSEFHALLASFEVPKAQQCRGFWANESDSESWPLRDVEGSQPHLTRV